jgi:hypothetical protein
MVVRQLKLKINSMRIIILILLLYLARPLNAQNLCTKEFNVYAMFALRGIGKLEKEFLKYKRNDFTLTIRDTSACAKLCNLLLYSNNVDLIVDFDPIHYDPQILIEFQNEKYEITHFWFLDSGGIYYDDKSQSYFQIKKPILKEVFEITCVSRILAFYGWGFK